MLLAVLTLITFPLKSENGEALTIYNPQRLPRRFGFDQGAMLVTGSTCINVWEAESRYVGASRDALPGDFDSIFWACKSRESVRSAEGAFYSFRCFKVFIQFVILNSAGPTIFVHAVLIPTRDPFLRVIKNFEGSTMPVEKARRQAESAPVQEVELPPQARLHPAPDHLSRPNPLRLA